MAIIKAQSDGDAAVVLLDDYDRLKLSAAIESYSKEKGLKVSDIASEIGVGRTYLYSLLDAKQIELNRLSKIQDILGITLLSEASVELYLSSLKSKLLSEEPPFKSQENYMSMRVPGYYFCKFIIEALQHEVSFFGSLEELSTEKDKNTFGNEYSNECMIHQKTIDYCENIIEALGGIEQLGYEFSKYLEDDKNFYVPIDPTSCLWQDVEEQTLDLIFDHFSGWKEEANELHKEELKNLTSYEEKEKEKRNHSDLLKNIRTQKKIIEKMNKRFFKEIYKLGDNLREDIEKIHKYCLENDRIHKRNLTWPYDYIEALENLESTTMSLKKSLPKIKKNKDLYKMLKDLGHFKDVND